MKKRLTGKPVCVAILAVLFVLSFVDVILRFTVFSDLAAHVAEYGEILITVGFSALLIIIGLMGKDRLFYICTGGFLFYFVLSQLFELPGEIATFVSLMTSLEIWTISPIPTILSFLLQILSMLCIVAIGGLLVEYMNDGSIYNKAYSTLCLAALLLQFAYVLIGIYDILSGSPAFFILSVIYSLSRIAMVSLLACFAYDSAKKQLAKANLQK